MDTIASYDSASIYSSENSFDDYESPSEEIGRSWQQRNELTGESRCHRPQDSALDSRFSTDSTHESSPGLGSGLTRSRSRAGSRYHQMGRDQDRAMHRPQIRRTYFGEFEDHDKQFKEESSHTHSRTAPSRRTRIPREPSVYRPGDTRSHRDFSFTRPNQGKSDLCGRKLVLSEKIQPSHDRMVNITPDLQVPLRGAEETVTAVRKDFYSNVSCFGCSVEVCCIADVSYVICPECKVISPLEGCLFEGKEVKRHGLGLGFTYDSLFQMQMDIIKERNESRAERQDGRHAPAAA